MRDAQDAAARLAAHQRRAAGVLHAGRKNLRRAGRIFAHQNDHRAGIRLRPALAHKNLRLFGSVAVAFGGAHLFSAHPAFKQRFAVEEERGHGF